MYMLWLRLVDSFKLHDSSQNISLFCRALLQKRPIILRSLLIEATTYQSSRRFKVRTRTHSHTHTHTHTHVHANTHTHRWRRRNKYINDDGATKQTERLSYEHCVAPHSTRWRLARVSSWMWVRV